VATVFRRSSSICCGHQCFSFSSAGASPLLASCVLLLVVAAVNLERLAVVAGGGDRHRIWFAPDTHSDAIVSGCAAALVWKYHLLRIPATRLAWALVGAVFPAGRQPGGAALAALRDAAAAGNGLQPLPVARAFHCLLRDQRIAGSCVGQRRVVPLRRKAVQTPVTHTDHGDAAATAR